MAGLVPRLSGSSKMVAANTPDSCGMHAESDLTQDFACANAIRPRGSGHGSRRRPPFLRLHEAFASIRDRARIQLSDSLDRHFWPHYLNRTAVGLSRPSTSCLRTKDVDARHKAGHD